MFASLKSRSFLQALSHPVLWCFLVLPSAAMSCFALQFASQPAPQAVFDLDHDREPVVSLDGLWRFHLGDDPAGGSVWASPSFDDSAWPLLRSDKPWSQQGYPAMAGFAWYRFQVQIPATANPSSPALSRDWAVLLVPIYTSYEIYVEGKLIGTSGRMPPVVAPYAMFQFHSFSLPTPANPIQNAEAARAPRTLHIALRVWHSDIWSNYIDGGPSRGGNLVGESSLIQTELRHRLTAGKVIFEDVYVFTIAGSLVGFTILGLFFFRPKEHEYLWFAILLLSVAADQAIQIIYYLYAVIPVPVFDLLDGTLVAINMASALAFFSIVLRARRGTIWRIILAFALISPFLNVLYWPGWLSVAASAALYLFCLLPSSLWILTVLVNRAIKRDPDAWLLIIPAGLYFGFFFLFNLTLAFSQAGWMVMPDALLEPLPLPPFTIHWMIFFDLIFLAALLAFLIRRFTQARQGEERYAGQLEAARQVQQVLLPEAIAQVPGFVVDCVYHPAEEVGGDFFQILPTTPETNGGGLLVVMGDVAGKGLPAAMMVSVLVGAIRTEATHTSDPATLLASLNERMLGRAQVGFTTCLCLHLNPDGQVTIASAGHLSPYLIAGDVITELALEPELPLGLLAPMSYKTSHFQLAAGQRLTLVSDGVLEAQSHRGELLGFDRTRQLSSQSAANIALAAKDFGQNDDITVVTIEFLGVPATIQSDLTSQALAG